MHPSRLPPGQQWAATGKWPTVGERRPRLSDEPWLLTIDGEVRRPTTWALDELRRRTWIERKCDIHCVTRWSKPDVVFRGILLSELLAEVEPNPQGKFMSFIARSDRDHSTSLPLADALALEVMVVFAADGAPLSTERGGPIRMMVPGRYFYKSVKWLTRIELLREDRLGYWEAVAGYHNEADPWREQRYLAPGLDRRQAAALLAARNFAGLDLRSLDARGHDLSGLQAAGALLRDADFRGANLAGAHFQGANLSNAHLAGANLSGASFTGADVEGADFTGCDLRGCDFRGASLLGVSFCARDVQVEEVRPLTERGGAWPLVDADTRFDAAALDTLCPPQDAVLKKLLAAA